MDRMRERRLGGRTTVVDPVDRSGCWVKAGDPGRDDRSISMAIWSYNQRSAVLAFGP